MTISDIFEKLQGPEREMIKTITISLYEMIIENFHSLVHLFYYLGSPEVEEADVSDINELRLESEFVIWLGGVQNKILNLKKQLRKSRLSILDLIQMKKEADFDKKKMIYNTIQLLADANS